MSGRVINSQAAGEGIQIRQGLHKYEDSLANDYRYRARIHYENNEAMSYRGADGQGWADDAGCGKTEGTAGQIV